MVRRTGLEPVWLPTRPSNVRVCQFRHPRILCRRLSATRVLYISSDKKSSTFAILLTFNLPFNFLRQFRSFSFMLCSNHDILFTLLYRPHLVISAVCAQLMLIASSGLRHIWLPSCPPLINILSFVSAEASKTVTNCFFMPIGEQAPRA